MIFLNNDAFFLSIKWMILICRMRFFSPLADKWRDERKPDELTNQNNRNRDVLFKTSTKCYILDLCHLRLYWILYNENMQNVPYTTCNPQIYNGIRVKQKKFVFFKSVGSTQMAEKLRNMWEREKNWNKEVSRGLLDTAKGSVSVLTSGNGTWCQPPA